MVWLEVGVELEGVELEFQAIDDSDPDPVITLEIEKSRQIQNNLRENHKDL